jgi:hypothetical protein
VHTINNIQSIGKPRWEVNLTLQQNSPIKNRSNLLDKYFDELLESRGGSKIERGL